MASINNGFFLESWPNFYDSSTPFDCDRLLVVVLHANLFLLTSSYNGCNRCDFLESFVGSFSLGA